MRHTLPVLAAVMVMAGCSSTSQSTAVGTASSGPAATSSSGPAGSTANGSADGSAGAAPRVSATSLPGVREYGLSDAQFTDYVERTQSAIADCMHQAGFEYVPVDVKTVELAQKRVRTDPGLTRRTFKEKWGLAVTTRFDDPVRDTGLGPNLAIWKGLPPTDQLAYSHTLFGPAAHHADFVWTLDEERLSETAGCTRTGVAKAFPAPMLKDTFVNPKDVLVDSDKRIVDARQNWSKCMRASGYEYKRDQDEIIDDLQGRLDEITGGADPSTLTGSKLAALKQLQQEEIKLSLADLECQIKYTDAVYRTVEIEIYGRPVSG